MVLYGVKWVKKVLLCGVKWVKKRFCCVVASALCSSVASVVVSGQRPVLHLHQRVGSAPPSVYLSCSVLHVAFAGEGGGRKGEGRGSFKFLDSLLCDCIYTPYRRSFSSKSGGFTVCSKEKRSTVTECIYIELIQ